MQDMKKPKDDALESPVDGMDPHHFAVVAAALLARSKENPKWEPSKKEEVWFVGVLAGISIVEGFNKARAKNDTASSKKPSVATASPSVFEQTFVGEECTVVGRRLTDAKTTMGPAHMPNHVNLGTAWNPADSIPKILIDFADTESIALPVEAAKMIADGIYEIILQIEAGTLRPEPTVTA
jgi:hypothetical protein